MVELAHNTIVDEIAELKEKEQRTRDALADSKANLAEDSVKLLNFIEKDQSKTEEEQKKADIKLAERKKIEGDIKVVDSEVATLKGDIEKNKDLLH